MILQTIDVRDTGLELLGLPTVPFLKIGITIASFNSLGTVSSERDLLKINWRGLEIVVFRDLSSFPDIWFGPEAKLSFSSDILSSKSLTENMM